MGQVWRQRSDALAPCSLHLLANTYIGYNSFKNNLRGSCDEAKASPK